MIGCLLLLGRLKFLMFLYANYSRKMTRSQRCVIKMLYLKGFWLKNSNFSKLARKREK